MLRGKDVRLWALEERREQLRGLVQHLPNAIRFSETFNVPLSELVRVVREHRLEGIVAKRAGGLYRSGERCGDWLKWRANRGQEFVIGGYIPNGNVLDSFLVGYHRGRDLLYAGAVRAGLSTAFRQVLPPHFEELQIPRCPFANLPDRAAKDAGPRVYNTASKMAMCRWLAGLGLC
jgi:bifunctional non-homologous end joining protein LigD